MLFRGWMEGWAGEENAIYNFFLLSLVVISSQSSISTRNSVELPARLVTWGSMSLSDRLERMPEMLQNNIYLRTTPLRPSLNIGIRVNPPCVHVNKQTSKARQTKATKSNHTHLPTNQPSNQPNQQSNKPTKQQTHQPTSKETKKQNKQMRQGLQPQGPNSPCVQWASRALGPKRIQGSAPSYGWIAGQILNWIYPLPTYIHTNLPNYHPTYLRTLWYDSTALGFLLLHFLTQLNLK